MKNKTIRTAITILGILALIALLYFGGGWLIETAMRMHGITG